MGDERSVAMTSPAADGTRSARSATCALRYFVLPAIACVLFTSAGFAPAQPTVTISPPVVKGRQSTTTTPSAVIDQSAAKRLEEEREFRMNRIIVEGFRDPDDRTPQPHILEQRFATSLSRGSPELLRGRIYDGCYYDGSYFSCADPLSSALRNLRHALR